MLEFPYEIFVAALPVMLASVATSAATAIGAFLLGASRRKHDMIDQLQEERDIRAKQIADLEAKIDAFYAFYADKHASRLYVAALLDHIWQRQQPPPPDPPAGYIP